MLTGRSAVSRKRRSTDHKSGRELHPLLTVFHCSLSCLFVAWRKEPFATDTYHSLSFISSSYKVAKTEQLGTHGNLEHGVNWNTG